MFSKTGRISYERLHVLQRKDDILNPQEKKRYLSAATTEMDDLVFSALIQEHQFAEKIQSFKNRNENNMLYLKAKDDEDLERAKIKKIKKEPQPFDFMESRFNFHTPKVQTASRRSTRTSTRLQASTTRNTRQYSRN